MNTHPTSRKDSNSPAFGFRQFESATTPNYQHDYDYDHEQRPRIMHQQNSLYGSSSLSSGQQNSSHMLDLANLHQNSPFLDQSERDFRLQANATHTRQLRQQQSSTSNNSKTANDVSLYSPSSSTSLLYHIYDQINLPNEQPNYTHQQQQNQLPVNSKKNNTTFLNPANLFASNVSHHHQQQQQLPLAMQLHQSQHSTDLHHYSASSSHYQPQQPQFSASTLHHSHSSYSQQTPQLTAGTDLMLDALMRHSSTTGSRLNPSSNQQQQQHQRPLSSSGGSSTLSAQSIHQQNPPLAYARQLRQPSNTTSTNSKSSMNLANVLQQNTATLGRLAAFGSSNGVATLHSANGKPHLFSDTINQATGNYWRRNCKRVRNIFIHNQTLVKSIFLLVLIAFSLMSIVKYAFSGASPSSNFNNQQQPQVLSAQQTSNSYNLNIPTLSSRGKFHGFDIRSSVEFVSFGCFFIGNYLLTQGELFHLPSRLGNLEASR